MNNNKLLSQMCQTPLDLYHKPEPQTEYFSLGPCPVTAPRWVHVRHSMTMMDVATSLSQSQWQKGRYKWCKGKRTISLGCTGTGVNNSAFSFTRFWGCGGMSQVEHSMCLMFGWQEKKEKEASGNCREKTHLSSTQTGTRQSFPISGHPLSITLILTSSFVMWLAQSNHEMLSQEASSVPFSGCQEVAASGPSMAEGAQVWPRSLPEFFSRKERRGCSSNQGIHVNDTLPPAFCSAQPIQTYTAIPEGSSWLYNTGKQY